LKTIDVISNSEVEADFNVCPHLYLCIIESYPGRINTIIPTILDKNINVLLQRSAAKLKTRLSIQIVAMCLWNNAGLTLQYFISKQYVDTLCTSVIQGLSLFTELHQKKRMLLGLASLFTVNPETLPTKISDSLPDLLHQLIKLTTEILELEEDEGFEDVDENDEDDGDGDEDKQNRKENKELVDDDDNNDYEEDEDDCNDDLSRDEEEDEFNNYEDISPLKNINEILYFKKCLEKLKTDYHSFFEKLISSLTSEEKQTMQDNINKAQEKQQELDKQLEESSVPYPQEN